MKEQNYGIGSITPFTGFWVSSVAAAPTSILFRATHWMMGRNPFRNGEGAIEMSLYNLASCGVKGVVSEAEPDAALLWWQVR